MSYVTSRQNITNFKIKSKEQKKNISFIY